MGSLTVAGSFEFEGVGGVHSSGTLADPKNRSRPVRPPSYPRHAPARERLGPRPGLSLSLSVFLFSLIDIVFENLKLLAEFGVHGIYAASGVPPDVDPPVR